MPLHLAVAGQSNSPISSYENAPGGAGGFIVRRNRGLRSGNIVKTYARLSRDRHALTTTERQEESEEGGKVQVSFHTARAHSGE